MESVSKITILGLKIMMKSALELFSLKSLHVENYLSFHISGKVFAQNYKFSNENNILPARRDFKKKDSGPLFTIIFRQKL